MCSKGIIFFAFLFRSVYGILDTELGTVVEDCKPTISIFNTIINTRYSYLEPKSKHYFKEGDELVIICQIPDHYPKSLKHNLTYKVDRNKDPFWTSSKGLTFMDVLRPNRQDYGTKISCMCVPEGSRALMATEVKLVLIPGYAYATTRLPVVRTTPRNLLPPTIMYSVPPIENIPTTQRIKGTTTAIYHENTDYEYPNHTWLLPLVASISGILILATILIGGFCVYHRVKKLQVQTQPVTQRSVNERVYYTVYEDHTYTYIDTEDVKRLRVQNESVINNPLY